MAAWYSENDSEDFLQDFNSYRLSAERLIADVNRGLLHINERLAEFPRPKGINHVLPWKKTVISPEEQVLLDKKKMLESQRDALTICARQPEWLLLEYDYLDNRAVVLAKDSVAMMPMTERQNVISVTWMTSAARTWLNDTFYNKWLTEKQRSRVLPSKVADPCDDAYDTEDKVFILSADEAEDYLHAGRLTGTTMKTRYAGFPLQYYSPGDSSSWWVRPEEGHYHVNGRGEVIRINSDVYAIHGIRPALAVAING